MTVTLEFFNGELLLNLNGYYNNKKLNQEYNDVNVIERFIDSLSVSDRAYIGKNNLKLYYSNCTIVLKDYPKNKDKYLYKKIYEKVQAETKLSRVSSSDTSKISKMFNVTKKFMNVRSITTVAVVMTIGIFAISNKNNEKLIVQSSEIVTTVPDEIEQMSTNIVNLQEVEQPTELETHVIILPEKPVIEEFNIAEYMVLDDRISEVKNIQSSDSKGVYKISEKLNQYGLNKMVSHIEENYEIFFDISSKYGVDPYWVVATSMVESSCNHIETLPGGSKYNGFGYGEMQIENTNFGGTITAFNYETNEYETIEITEENVKDFYTNVQIGAMKMQNNLKKFNGNFYMATQAYNYGSGMMKIIVQKYADEIGKTFEEVTLDINDFGWMKYVNDVHNNPKKYLSNWKYSAFGNNYYIQEVLNYYMGENIVNRVQDNYYVLDLVNNKQTLHQAVSKIK